MSLTGAQFQQLQEALISAFPTSDQLAQMVQHQLNENLEAVAGTGVLSTVVYKLIQWAEGRGRTEQLVQGALRENPDHPALSGVGALLGMAAPAGPAGGAAPGAGPVAVDPVAQWLRFGLQRHGQVRVVGFREQHQIPIDLDQVFVPLSVHAARGRRAGAPGSLDKEGTAHEGASEVSLDDALALGTDWSTELGTGGSSGLGTDPAGQTRLALLGYPGAGKTTLLRHLYRRGAARAFAGPIAHLNGLFPLFLRLSDVTGEELGERGLRRVVEREARAYPEAGRRLLAQERPFLFLLDGLDEVRDEEGRKRLCRWLNREVDHWPGSAFVATSRPAAWERTPDLAARFLPVSLGGLRPEAVELYVRRWFTAVELHFRGADPVAVAEARARDRAEALLSVIGAEGRRGQGHIALTRLAEMTANPLMLSTLCLVHYRDRELPRQRAELYDRCIGLLLETWPHERTGRRGLLANDAARQVLQPLAYAMQERDLRELPLTDAAQVVREPLAEVPALKDLAEEPRRFLELVRDECGVLAGRDLEHIEFFHLHFQEYLAAAHVAERNLARALADRAGQPRWEEVILLAMSMPGVFRPFMERALEQGHARTHERLLRQCLVEAIRLDAEPFVAATDRALARLARPPGALAGLWRRLVGAPPPPDPAAELSTLFALLRGYELPGVLDRARRLLDHPDRALRDAARALAGMDGEALAGTPRAGEPFTEPTTGLSLLWIPPGRFTMGSSKERGLPNFDPEAFDGELPAHPVQISQGYWLGEHAVTNEQYGRFVTATGHRAPESLGDRRFNDPAQPVVTVDWEDARAFCAWLSAALPAEAGLRFDLPAEAEWEYAARGSDGRKYPWGKDEPDAERACYGQKWQSGQPTAVGRHPSGKSPFGAHDMAGNVWEWCLDTWRENYGSDGPVVDPCHQDGNRASPRVVRGGSWSLDPGLLRCAYRSGLRPGAPAPGPRFPGGVSWSPPALNLVI